jgi:hypothetical protein
VLTKYTWLAGTDALGRVQERRTMTDGFVWDEASVSYPDWSGNAQLDQRRTSAGLEEIVGLDPEIWMAIGLDIGGGESSHELRVVAVHRDLFTAEGDVFPKIAAAYGGEIPATEFLIHDVDPYEVLRAVTHVFEMRLRRRGCRDLPIRVMSRSDVPEQPVA